LARHSILALFVVVPLSELQGESRGVIGHMTYAGRSDEFGLSRRLVDLKKPIIVLAARQRQFNDIKKL